MTGRSNLGVKVQVFAEMSQPESIRVKTILNRAAKELDDMDDEDIHAAKAFAGIFPQISIPIVEGGKVSNV